MPSHRSRGHPSARFADRITEADMVKCCKGVGPDADSRARGRVRTALEDGDVVSTSLQRDRRRKACDTRTDYDDLLLPHPSNVSRRMGILYTSNTSSVLVAV